jgi:hypothetical protein
MWSGAMDDMARPKIAALGIFTAPALDFPDLGGKPIWAMI